MIKKFWIRIAYLGGHLLEKNGFWIDKENEIVQDDYLKLPLLGKIGYNLMCFGLKRGGFKSIITKMINNYYT